MQEVFLGHSVEIALPLIACEVFCSGKRPGALQDYFNGEVGCYVLHVVKIVCLFGRSSALAMSSEAEMDTELELLANSAVLGDQLHKQLSSFANGLTDLCNRKQRQFEGCLFFRTFDKVCLLVTKNNAFLCFIFPSKLSDGL